MTKDYNRAVDAVRFGYSADPEEYRIYEQYKNATLLSDWEERERRFRPELAGRYADVLFREGILPQPGMANGFVFFSPSANQGWYEYAFAKRVDDMLTEGSSGARPLFIAADFFGIKSDVFEPGFDRNVFTGEDLRNVKLVKVSSEAERIPLIPACVNVIWDRLGALRFAHSMRTRGIDSRMIETVLGQYKRLLKPGGCVVIDAAEVDIEEGLVSTFDYLNGRLPRQEHANPQHKLDLEQLGWTVRSIGSGMERLMVLEPAAT